MIDFSPDTAAPITELQNVIKTWADRGVAGFNIQSDQLIANIINGDQVNSLFLGSGAVSDKFLVRDISSLSITLLKTVTSSIRQIKI